MPFGTRFIAGTLAFINRLAQKNLCGKLGLYEKRKFLVFKDSFDQIRAA